MLKANEEIIKTIKPGIPTAELNAKANDLLGEACVSLGLLEDKKDFRKYYFHSIGHSLGLDTHDVIIDRNFTFEPGMVYTVEPGLYIPEESIGIRIEDDILVTEDGSINLTKDIICDSDTYILCIPSYTTLKHQLYTSATIPFLLNHSAYLINNTNNYCASTLTLFIFQLILYNYFFIMK